MLVLGIDTLEFGIEIEEYEQVFRPLLGTFRILKEAAQETGDEPEITIDNLTLKVHASGIHFYAYRLTCEDFTICFAEKELPNNTPIWVRFSSGYLWSFMATGAFKRFMEWFRVFDVDVLGTKVSRADLCADTDEVSFTPSDAKGFVTRAKSKSRHCVDDDHFDGKVFSGFTIGRGQPMLARIYHKSLEVRKSGKLWFYEVWGANGWEGVDEVWRVEFQLRRGVLKEVGVSNIHELFENIDGLWAYLTREWLTLRQPKRETNVSRWPLKRKWMEIAAAKFNHQTSPLVRRRVREGNLRQLMNQAAGLAVSIAALGDHDSLGETLQTLGYWTELRLSRKNTSFDGEKANRKSRFLP